MWVCVTFVIPIFICPPKYESRPTAIPPAVLKLPPLVTDKAFVVLLMDIPPTRVNAPVVVEVLLVPLVSVKFGWIVGVVIICGSTTSSKFTALLWGTVSVTVIVYVAVLLEVVATPEISPFAGLKPKKKDSVYEVSILDLFSGKKKIQLIELALNTTNSTSQIINTKETSFKYKNTKHKRVYRLLQCNQQG